MPEMKMSLDILQERHPVEVEKILSNIRKGKSKHRKDSAESFEWSYYWGVMIKAHGIADLFNGNMQRDAEIEMNKSFEQKIRDYAGNCMVTVKAEKGRYCNSESIEGCPSEILVDYRESLIKGQKEQDRVAALSDEERESEMQGLLSELGGPGFMEMQMGSPIGPATELPTGPTIESPPGKKKLLAYNCVVCDEDFNTPSESCQNCGNKGSVIIRE